MCHGRVLQDGQDQQWIEHAEAKFCQNFCAEDARWLCAWHVVEPQSVCRKTQVVDLLGGVFIRGRGWMGNA